MGRARGSGVRGGDRARARVKKVSFLRTMCAAVEQCNRWTEARGRIGEMVYVKKG